MMVCVIVSVMLCVMICMTVSVMLIELTLNKLFEPGHFKLLFPCGGWLCVMVCMIVNCCSPEAGCM